MSDEPLPPTDQASSSSWSSPGGMLERLQARPPGESRYDVQEEIARGGMGAILRAWDGDLRRALAMKVALGKKPMREGSGGTTLDDKTLGRFLEEAQITAQLDHPGIVPVHELGMDSKGQIFFTMALVQGVHLGVVLRSLHGESMEGQPALPEGDWTQTRVLGVLLKVCEAMSYAHAKKVLHRDLKPANIMVGSFGQVYVMDWGLARVLEEEISEGPEQAAHSETKIRAASYVAPVQSDRRDAVAGDVSSPLLTMDGDVVGTPAYMSPEQARAEWGVVGPPTDVYAIGAILYHVLVGHMPYGERGEKERPGVEVWQAVRKGPPPPLLRLVPEAPPELIAICEKAMARDPEERYPDTHALGEDLRAYLEGRVVQAWRTGPIIELRKWIARNKALALVSAAALLLGVAGLAGAGWVQLRANALLEERNVDLQAARAESERQAGLLRLDGAALRAARAANEAALQKAREEGYVAAINAAALSLETGNQPEVRRQLDRTPEDLRAWEWNHLDLAEDGSVGELPDLDGAVRFAIFHPDGQRLLVGLNVGRAVLTSVADTVAQRTIEFDLKGREAMHGALARDGSRVLFGFAKGGLAVYRCRDGSLEAELPNRGVRWIGVDSWGNPETGAHGFVSLDGAGSLSCWDVSGAMLATRELPASSYMGQSTHQQISSPVRRDVAVLLKTGGRMETFSLPGLATLDEVVVDSLAARFALHPDGMRAAILRGDGRMGEVRLNGREDVEWMDSGMVARPVQVAYTADGEGLLVGSRDRLVSLVSTPELEFVRTPAHTTGNSRFAVDPTGERVLTYRESPARFWNLWSHRQGTPLELPGPARSVHVSPDGRRIAVSIIGASRIHLVDGQTGDALGGLGQPSSAPTSIAFDPGWNYCAMATARGQVALWDAETGELLHELEGHEERVLAFAFSPDGQIVATAGREGLVRLWRTSSGQLISIPVQSSSNINFLEFHPSGRQLAWGDSDGGVTLLDLAGMQRIPLVLEGRPIRNLAFAPDGSWVALPATDNTVRILRLADLSTLSVLQGHTSEVSCIDVFPDGRRLVTGSDDGDTRVWEPESGRCLAVLDGHMGTISSLAVSPSGTRILSVGMDETLRLWEGDKADAIPMWEGAAARDRATVLLIEGWLETGSLERALARFRSDGNLQALEETANRLARSWKDSSGEILAEKLWERAWPRRTELADLERVKQVAQEVLGFEELSLPARSYLRDIVALCSLRQGEWEEARKALRASRTRRDPSRRRTLLPQSKDMQAIRKILAAQLEAEVGDVQKARKLLDEVDRPRARDDRSLRMIYLDVRQRLDPE